MWNVMCGEFKSLRKCIEERMDKDYTAIGYSRHVELSTHQSTHQMNDMQCWGIEWKGYKCIQSWCNGRISF